MGQDDIDPAEARRIMGPAAIIGLSTHSREQIEAAASLPVDYISVGPIWETPTKEGRPATGLELIRDAAEIAKQPWFAIGGIDTGNAATGRRGGGRATLRGPGDPRCRDPRAAATALFDLVDPAAQPKGDERPRAEAGRAPEAKAPLGRAGRSAERRRREPQRRRGAETETFQESMARRYEERNAEARAKLEPLDRGERPTAVTVGAVVSSVLAIAITVQGVLSLAGVSTGEGRDPPRAADPLRGRPLGDGGGDVEGPLLGRARLPDCAPSDDARERSRAGRGHSVLQAVGTTLLLLGSGALFYFMVRAMARIQMPSGPGSATARPV